MSATIMFMPELMSSHLAKKSGLETSDMDQSGVLGYEVVQRNDLVSYSVPLSSGDCRNHHIDHFRLRQATADIQENTE